MASKLRAADTAAPMTDAAYRKREERWRAEADLDTLLSAARIRKDPKRLKAAINIAKERKGELASVSESELEGEGKEEPKGRDDE